MFSYLKMLEYPIKIKNPNPRLATIVATQYGGPDFNCLRENPRFCVNLIFGLHKPFIKLYQNPYPCKG